MPFRDIEFKTLNSLTLRGWLFTPSFFTGELPYLIMAHGFMVYKKIRSNNFMEYFISNLHITCLAYNIYCIDIDNSKLI
ncbi:hypothetical protein ASPBRDRAFT_138251 [Aspergillus brasiliensis CBS 101740]|uniref:Uncharacterized protein n=1 Tax=Aspergillus brasiliensis (strain CBS 101740 / IMI 381727 / IBT 21946) TaxID=767769 RepID=A0A1L9U454_ASPBC|nr:hypothetical protein ASPBRDRAFT_138251 [Aspergillus brasiliensis CBS 101740]